jgi:hypothetical protein
LLTSSDFVSVGVDSLFNQEVSLHIVEGYGHAATVTSLVSGVTVNELLLGEAQKCSW